MQYWNPNSGVASLYTTGGHLTADMKPVAMCLIGMDQNFLQFPELF